MIFGYTRVSTTDQNAARQHLAITEYAKDNGISIDRMYEDEASGKDFNRPKYQALKDSLRAGDMFPIYILLCERMFLYGYRESRSSGFPYLTGFHS